MSNVLEFKTKPTPPFFVIDAQIALDEEGYLITVRATGDSQERLPERFKSVDAFVAKALWQASWCFFSSHARDDTDDPEAVVFISTVARGSRVTVQSPIADHPDAFTTEERMSWLQRRANDMVPLAAPSWSEEQPASGTTSASPSANIDQLSFSW